MEFLAASYEAEGLMSYALHPGGVKTRMSTDKDKVPEQLSNSKSHVLNEKECTLLTSVIQCASTHLISQPEWQYG
jgi:hypothetical protein